MNTVRGLLIILVLAIVAYSIATVIAIVPSGANLSDLGNETAPADPAQKHEAIAGNVTELDITGYTTTQSWQGYYGNVTGTIQLADNDDAVMYNWSLASPEGEVYAARNSTINWNYIMCFNFTADGTLSDDYDQNGSTSLYGRNLTWLEDAYNITSDDVDGINETFSRPNNHDEFMVNNLNFTISECLSTRIFDANKTGVDNNFEEVLLYESLSDVVIYASILDEEDNQGFDGNFHDFEMIVLEDGHGTDTTSSSYWFWIELE